MMQGRAPGRRGPGNYAKPQNKVQKKTLVRLSKYLWEYKVRLVFVILCIIISSIVGVAISTSIGRLIDDYITPMLVTGSTDFSPLLKAVITMAVICAMGVISTFLYNRFMVDIAQGVLKSIRNKMFSHMQGLSIKYFDTHSHGDVMSHYTNDTDTLRQMISQTVPHLFSSLVSIVSVFAAMVSTSIYLTVFVLISVSGMLFLAGKIGGKSGSFFVKQQKSLGKINGFIEEMVNGQKGVTLLKF